MLDAESKNGMEMAKQFMVLLQQISTSWNAGYFRFYRTEGENGANASYVDGAGTSLVGALRHREFYEAMREQGLALFAALARARGVLLIKAKNDFSYDLKIDFDNLDRWKITKLGGSSGIPEDGESQGS